MRVVTTVHKAGFEQYGHRWVEGVRNWPAGTEFVMYAEGFATEAVRCKRVEDLPALVAFKTKYAHYKPLNWQWDIVRFANKVYAARDAFYDFDGIGVWLDCDAVTYNPLPEGYVESLLNGAFMGLFKRTGYHSETGFWVMDCSHQRKKTFFDAWLAWFEEGAFKMLPEWHDCTTLDATVARFEKEGLIRTVSLSQGHEREMHPLVLSDLGQFIDHLKGRRKTLTHSPENPHVSV